MKIRKDLPRFNNEKALIVATGEYTAFLYIAHEGNIVLADSFIIEKPTFTDTKKEGRFGSIGAGSFSSGSVYESQRQFMQNRFQNMLKDRIDILNNKEDPDSIYLFTPQYVSKGIEQTLNKFDEKLKMVRNGNLVNHHPFELLEKIKEYKFFEVGVPVFKTEARKIYR